MKGLQAIVLATLEVLPLVLWISEATPSSMRSCTRNRALVACVHPSCIEQRVRVLVGCWVFGGMDKAV